MLREEILYKTSITGTTVFYFVPNVTPELVPFLEEPAYVMFNNLNVPVEYHIYGSGSTELWNLQNISGYNLNSPLSAVTTNYVTGYSISNTVKKTISSTERIQIQQRFNNNIISTITAQTQVLSSYQTYVFFEEKEVDDMFANIKLSRSYESLDTLKIYNKPINTITAQEANTGILFGKLQAIQILKDEAGNNIKIPLKNVPVGIFNKSDEFTTPMSLDSNGDRFFMNIKESSLHGQYFDSTSYSEDQKFLKSQSQFNLMPDKFKYVTVTNDNGEFVIYDAPIGSSVVVFEVDLFKQGLTKDEIVLNNFPFPVNDDANIGEFPCYYYNQVPVDVVSAWGSIQTGYTELNVNVNLDLRKWATYIFAPGAYGNEKLEKTVANNFINTLKIKVRDMTNKKFADKILELAQVPNDLDRRPGSNYFWFTELLDQRQSVEYYKFGCHVVKLPANLYDPNGYKTDNQGVPTNSKGLWLAAYQFRVYINDKTCFRDTGGYSYNGDFWSHYDVNFYGGAPVGSQPFDGLNRFPYEKPWTISYPEPYKIPAMPTQKRYDWGGQRTFGNGSNSGTTNNPYIMEEPAYSDGDLVGNMVYPQGFPNGVSGGFGIQSPNGVWAPNQIAYVATKDYMYKYESGIRWDEKYANGYEPYWNQSALGPYNISNIYISPPNYHALAGMSRVVNGEKFQRVECGYGYFMKYHDWPRVYRALWAGDIYFGPDIQTGIPGFTPSNYVIGNSSDHSYMKSLTGWQSNTYDLDDQNLAFAFNQISHPKEGIDIYRIVKSGLDDIKIPENFIIPTSTVLRLGGQANECGALSLRNDGSVDVLMKNNFTSINVQNPSGGTIVILVGNTFTLNPGGTFSINGSPSVEDSVRYSSLILPGNDNFNTSTNKYETCRYSVIVTFIGLLRVSGSGNIPYVGATVDLPFVVNAYIQPVSWYIETTISGDDVNGASPSRFGISSFNVTDTNAHPRAVWSLAFDSSQLYPQT